MRNFETPKMDVTMFAIENILTESVVSTPAPQMAAIINLDSNGSANDVLTAQKSFNDLMNIAK